MKLSPPHPVTRNVLPLFELPVRKNKNLNFEMEGREDGWRWLFSLSLSIVSQTFCRRL